MNEEVGGVDETEAVARLRKNAAPRAPLFSEHNLSFLANYYTSNIMSRVCGIDAQRQLDLWAAIMLFARHAWTSAGHSAECVHEASKSRALFRCTATQEVCH